MSKIEEKEEYKPNDFWHNPKDTITADDTRTNGAGIINTIDVLQDAVHKNDKVTEGIAGAGLALDVLGLVIDPLGTVLAAGIGWLIDHITPFRIPLDLLMGDPEGITVATAAIGKEKDKVDEWSKDLKKDLDNLMESWSGEGADAFKESTNSLADGITALGESLESAKKTMSICGAVIGAVRGIIRDLIAGVLGGILAGAIAAVAAMPFTFGASVGIFLGTVAATVAVAMGQIAVQISKLVKNLTAAAKAVKDVAKGTKGLGDDAARAADGVAPPSTGGGRGNTGGGTGGGRDTPDGTNTGGNTGGGRDTDNAGGNTGGGRDNDTPESSNTGGGRDNDPWGDNNDPTFNPWADEHSGGGRDTPDSISGGRDPLADDPELTHNPWADQPSGGRDTPDGTGTGGGRDPLADNPELTHNPWADQPSGGRDTPDNTGTGGGHDTDNAGGNTGGGRDNENTGGGRDNDTPDNTGGGHDNAGGGKDKSWIYDSSDKTHDLFMDGARKYASEHPEKGITGQQIDDFGSKMDKILKVMNGTPTALEKAGMDPITVKQIENVVKTVTDSTHSPTATVTKSVIDFIRFGAFPAMQNAGVFPDEWRGENA